MTRVISKPDGTLRARDGRQIGYGEFGDPEGKPVVLFHGYGDSRLTRHPDDELTARLGVRLITVDRPGIGLTDPMKELSLIERLHDIEEVTEALKIDRFAVLGWSGGAPFALAAAYEFGHYVTRVGIAGGFGPFERPGFRRLAPKEIRRVILILKAAPWMSGTLAKESAKQLEGGNRSSMSNGDGLASSSDAALLARGAIGDNIRRGAEEAFRQGHEGVAADMLLVFRFKWGFRPEDVTRPVELWYGDEDQMTPVEVGRGLASLLPDARLRVSPGAGHLLHIRYWEEILQTLTESRPVEVRVAPPWVEPVVVEPAATERPFAPTLAETTAVGQHAEPPEATRADAAPVAAAATPDVAETPAAVEPEERELAAAAAAPARWAETVAAPPRRDVPPFTVRPAAFSPAADERERLRAAGFLIEDDEPEPVAAEPEAVLAEPEAVAAEAEAVAAEPEAVAAEPEAVAAEPEAVAAEPEAVTEEPVAVIVEAEALTAEPQAVAAEPEAVAAEPEVLTEEPEAVAAEPEAVAAEPEAVAAEPEAVAAETEALTAEPEVVAAETEAVAAEPEAVEVPPSDVEVIAAEQAPAEHAEVEADAQPSPIPAMAPSIKHDEFERLRAAGFLVDDEAADYLAAALGSLTTEQPDRVSAETAVEPAIEPQATPAAPEDALEPSEAPVAGAEDETGLLDSAPTAAEVPAADEGSEGEREDRAEPESLAATEGGDAVPLHMAATDAAERLRDAGYAIEDTGPADESIGMEVPADADAAAAAIVEAVAEEAGLEGAVPDTVAPDAALLEEQPTEPAAGFEEGAASDAASDVDLVAVAVDAAAEPEVGAEDENERLRAAGFPATVDEDAERGDITDDTEVAAVSADQRRADDLDQRLEAFAERYVATGDVTDDSELSALEEADTQATGSEAETSESAAPRLDEAEAIAAQGDEGEPTAAELDAGEPAAAQFEEGEPVAQHAENGEPIAEAAEEREPEAAHADESALHPLPSEPAVAPESNGDAAPEVDPLLERLRAAGFAVLDPVSPAGR